MVVFEWAEPALGAGTAKVMVIAELVRIFALLNNLQNGNIYADLIVKTAKTRIPIWQFRWNQLVYRRRLACSCTGPWLGCKREADFGGRAGT